MTVKQVITEIDKHIKTVGFSSIAVGGDGETPPFTYSVGFTETLGKPEIIIMTLRPDIAHMFMHEIYNRWKDGDTHEVDKIYHDLSEKYPSCFLKGERDLFREHTTACTARYDNNYEVWQFVWTDTNGKFPWDKNYSQEDFRQPLIGKRKAEVIQLV